MIGDPSFHSGSNAQATMHLAEIVVHEVKGNRVFEVLNLLRKGICKAGHPLEPSQRRSATIGKPIVIERNVWIAAGATIIGGVTVGENSVVAAGSVVTKSVPPNTLVGGNPARVIRSIGEDEERPQ